MHLGPDTHVHWPRQIYVSVKTRNIMCLGWDIQVSRPACICLGRNQWGDIRFWRPKSSKGLDSLRQMIPQRPQPEVFATRGKWKGTRAQRETKRYKRNNDRGKRKTERRRNMAREEHERAQEESERAWEENKKAQQDKLVKCQRDGKMIKMKGMK